MPNSPENTPVAGGSGSGTTSRSPTPTGSTGGGSRLSRIMTNLSNADC